MASKYFIYSTCEKVLEAQFAPLFNPFHLKPTNKNKKKRQIL